MAACLFPQGDEGSPGPRGPGGERVSSQLLSFFFGLFVQIWKHNFSYHVSFLILQGEAGSPGQPGPDGVRGDRGVPVGVIILYFTLYYFFFPHLSLQTY